MTATTNDFDAAKAVVDQLNGMDKERQHRILRWVAESLSIELGGASPLLGRSSGDQQSADSETHNVRLPASRQQVSTDIKSFVESKKPKSDVQFAAVVAYYYRFDAPQEKRKDSIDASALQEAARLVGRRRPARPRMTLNNAKNQGYLDSAERGQFQINSVGENLVAMTLPGGEVERSPRRSPRAVANKKKSTSAKQKPRTTSRKSSTKK